MKNLLALFAFLVLALMPLACTDRAINQPVTPNLGAGSNAVATPTP